VQQEIWPFYLAEQWIAETETKDGCERNLKRVTDDVRGTTAGSDVFLAGLVTMGAPVLLISEDDDGVCI
jgi:hypothetical protein